MSGCARTMVFAGLFVLSSVVGCGSQSADNSGKDGGAAVRQLAAIHRRDDGMAKGQGLHGLSNPLRFTVIDCVRSARVHRAVVAASGADVSQDQERGGAGVPAFPSIWTACLFADGVELEAIHRVLDVEIIRTSLGIDLEPTRQAWAFSRSELVDGD